MSFTSSLHRFLSVALLATGVSMGAAQTTPSAADAAAKENARKSAISASDAKKLQERLNAQRDGMIADLETLAKQMRDATDEQKKAIKEKMQARMKAFEEAQSALNRQVRDEQRRLRQNAGKH